MGMLVVYLACLGLGGLWRLADRRPAIHADRDGLKFHPSIHSAPVSWNEVRSVRLTDALPPEVKISLTRRFWSPLAWLTSRSVSLNIIALGLTQREAQEKVRLIGQWLG
jgi:hypothetical protein